MSNHAAVFQGPNVEDRIARRLALPAVLLCCTLLLGGCVKVPLGSVTTTSTAPASIATSSHPNASQATTAVAASAVGTPLTTGSWRVTVAKTRMIQKSPSGARAPSGKSFLYIEVQFNNVQISESLLARPEYFALKNASGKKYATVGTDSGFNLHGMRTIDPGYGGMTEFVYLVPKGSSDYLFTCAPKSDGTNLAILSWRVP
jgi:hypothetical protein